MVSIDKVVRRFAQLDEYQVLLARIAEKSEALFLADKLLVGSAKYYLQVSIESCLVFHRLKTVICERQTMFERSYCRPRLPRPGINRKSSVPTAVLR